MSRAAAALLCLLAAGCASFGDPTRPVHPVDGVRKVVDSLGEEIGTRAVAEPFRGLPIVIRTTTAANSGIEPIIAELLRTRLVERGLAVDAVCAPRCLEISLQELAVEAAKAALSAGQLLSVAGGHVPVVGGLIRTIGEQEREKEHAAGRANGLFVTLAARDGNRYGARAHLVAIISAGEIALERR